MKSYNLGQILVGAGILTAAFYFGINYKSSQNQVVSNSVSELANEDLTLHTPMLPAPNGSDSPKLDGKKKSEVVPNPTDKTMVPNLTQSPASMPNFTHPNLAHQEPVVISPSEPDFSRLLQDVQAHDQSGSAQPSRTSQNQIDTSPAADTPFNKIPNLPKSGQPAPMDQIDNSKFKPLLPPDDRSILTPENSRLEFSGNSTPRSPVATQARSGSLIPIDGQDRGFQLPHATRFQVHVIRAGESLKTISEFYYQTPDHYLELYVANQDILPSPIQLPEGKTIKIPDVSDLTTASTRNEKN